jgi:hypothetical protein
MTENTFQENRYKVIKKLIDPTEYQALLKLSEEKGQIYNEGVEGFQTFANTEKFEKLLEDLKPVIESHSGYKLFKTYFFARKYKEGSVLPVHTDRNSCEISVSICLGFEKEPWPIWVMDKDEVPQSIILMPGDALLYKGIEVAHWRAKNIYGPCHQVFLHYVNQNGPYSIHKDDRNLNKYFSFRFLNKIFRFSIQPFYKK